MGDDTEELTRVGHRSPALWIGAWVVGLLAVAGLALAGRPAIEPNQATVVPATTAGTPVTAALPSSARGSRVDAAGVLLKSPAIDAAPVTSSGMIVKGEYPDPDRPLKIALFNMWGDELAGANLLVRGEFTVVLRLPDPRPIGPAILQIRRVDRTGLAELMLERPLVIGPLALARAAVQRPPLGEDGLIGGLVFGTAWPPGD